MIVAERMWVCSLCEFKTDGNHRMVRHLEEQHYLKAPEISQGQTLIRVDERQCPTTKEK